MAEQQAGEWLTLEQAAVRLQTKARTVSRLISSGKLRSVRLSAREGRRVRSSDVDALATAPAENESEAEP